MSPTWYMLITRRRERPGDGWDAASLPFCDEWEHVIERIKRAELERPGREVFSLQAPSEHELQAKWMDVLRGMNVSVFTYERSAEDTRRLALEMSDGPDHDVPYRFIHMQHILDIKAWEAWLRLAARVTRGELGGPDDGQLPENEVAAAA